MSTRDDLLSALQDNNVQAFLRVIRHGESSQEPDAYYMHFGGELFDSFADHPRKAITKGQYTSTAAGAYQILRRTWDGVAVKWGLPDFSPINQDCAAVALIAGRGALTPLLEGDFDEAIHRCAQEWASLPGSPYGQPTFSLEKAREVFQSYGGRIESGPSGEAHQPVPVTPPQSEIMAPLLALLPTILGSLAPLIPQLGALFGSGSEVANRNVMAAKVIADKLVEVTGAVNMMEAAEKIQSDPQALQVARSAVAQLFPEIGEVGGGVNAARVAQATPDQLPFHKQAVFWVTCGVLPLVYLIVLAALGKWEYIGDITSETRAQVIGTVLGTLIGGIVGYFYGTSAGSQRKTDILGAK